MSRPLFSCVVPEKGARPFIAEALASLEAQGMGEEMEVIVQDGTTEYTEDTEIPEGLNVQWFRERDVGQSDALNKGFAKAKGEWLFWLNADDVLLPGALKKVCELISSHAPSTSDEVTQAPSTSAAKPHESTLSWIAGNVVYMDGAGCAKWCAWDRGWKLSYAGLPVQVYGPSSFFRRELFERSGGFDVSLNYVMDVDLWCKFRKMGYWYKKIPDFVWGFRLHDGSKTSCAQEGRWTQEQSAEQEIVNERYGLGHVGLASKVAQFSRVVNGSYIRSWIETRKRNGKPVI